MSRPKSEPPSEAPAEPVVIVEPATDERATASRSSVPKRIMPKRRIVGGAGASSKGEASTGKAATRKAATSGSRSEAGAGTDDSDDESSENESREPRDDDDEDVIEVAGEVVLDEPDASPDDAGATALTPRSTALGPSDPLQAYLREIQRYKLLTREEEQDLTERYVQAQRDESPESQAQARKIAARLVTANLRLVVKLAYEYRRAYKNILDLVQEGNIGLMQAVKRYDPSRGVKLSSYAAYWIRAYMLRFILNNWRLVKLGTTQAQRKLFFNLNKEKARLAAMGIDPTAEVIAERLGVEAKEVVEMDHRLASSEASLDAPVGDGDGKGTSRVDLLPAHGATADHLLERHEMDAMVAERLKIFRQTLKGKDVIIFDRRMAADEPVTLQELGDEFGVSRERVRQLEARIAGKLREYLRAELGDAVTND